jgi:hypothetical protein
MNCPSCAKIPNTHSFTNFGKIGETRYYYSSPSRAKDYETESIRLENFKKHIRLAATAGKWIWVIDLTGSELKDFTSISFNLGLASAIVYEFSDSIQEVWIINLNSWAKPVIATIKQMFNHNLFNGLQLVNGTGLDLYLELKNKGISGAPLLWLNKAIATKPDSPLEKPQSVS